MMPELLPNCTTYTCFCRLEQAPVLAAASLPAAAWTVAGALELRFPRGALADGDAFELALSACTKGPELVRAVSALRGALSTSGEPPVGPGNGCSIAVASVATQRGLCSRGSLGSEELETAGLPPEAA
mmetsp:Transcript_52142/g.124214  ORF Transcript_52142/g.124214 Transcript_52142/m.124214 type:complete len:128 (-) Transcript_52142:246-629(-)